MISLKATTAQKLVQARDLFEHANDHYDKCNEERHRASRFYHNTEGEGQWEEDDREVLRKAGRPAFTFNILKPKVDTAIGMHKDMQRRAVAQPTGNEDRFLAEALNTIKERIRDQAKIDAVDGAVLKNGYIKGEGIAHLDATTAPDDPTYIQVEAFSVSPHEIDWDPDSIEPDRRDANYVCWSRWFTKNQFKKEYPKHKNKWEVLARGDNEDNLSRNPELFGETHIGKEDYDSSSHYYWDRHRKRARVVHLEYKVWRRQKYAINDQGPLKIKDKEASIIQKAQSFGLFQDYQIKSTDVEDTHVIEFVSETVLYDSTESDESHYPFDGFGLIPFDYAIDEEGGVPHGMVRNLIDPQQELNKAWSLTLEHVRGQGRPGYIAEEDSIPDVSAFESAVATTGVVATVAKGALSSSAIQERKVPTPSPAEQQRLENSFRVMEMISGITTDMQQPAAQQEAATTVAIRYHKTQLGLAETRANYDTYQRELEIRILQIIVRAMPDHQITAMLGNDDKFVVQDGVLVEMMPHPEQPGQKIPARQAPIKSLRALRYDIEMTNTTENTTLRLLELQGLMQLAQALPGSVDPMLLVEKAASSRADRERLKDFAQQNSQQQARMAQDQANQANAQVEKTLQIEADKNAERARHNKVDEMLQAEKQQDDASLEMASIMERASADEMKAIAAVFQTIKQNQTARIVSSERGRVQ